MEVVAKPQLYLYTLTAVQIVLDYNQEEATIIGTLLHDTVEDIYMCSAVLQQKF